MASTVHAPWITAPATRAVIDALTAGGADVRFVGGCVRDALLGRESSDIDIGTPDRPEHVLALLTRANIETRTVPRGIEHGTVTAFSGGQRYEITTLRRDERTDGRHAEVAFTDDWREDAARRDFTINAMSATPNGTLHDHFGGQEDLAAGRVRFVGDPATRIAEDYLRLLRFFRFFAWYGRGEPDGVALAACADAAETIPSLSGERVRDEMMKLLADPDPLPALRAMQAASILARVLPEAQGTAHLVRLVKVEHDLSEPADPIRRLAALIVDADYDNTANAVAVSVIANRWRLTNTEGERLVALVVPSQILTPTTDRHTQRRLLYRLGTDTLRDLVFFVWAGWGGSETGWRAILDSTDSWEKPVFPVTGTDVLALGIPEGPEVGHYLTTIETWWIERDFVPDRKIALAMLRSLVDARRTE